MAVRYLITGASGLLGSYLIPCIQQAGHEVVAITNSHSLSPALVGVTAFQCDITERDTLDRTLDKISPDIIIHAAGMTSVDQCEIDPLAAKLMNTDVPSWIAQWSSAHGRKYIFISSDHVTGGDRPFFSEVDPISPVNVYARTKAEAEVSVLAAAPLAQVIRTNFFGRGPLWRKSLTDWLWDRSRQTESIPAFTDSFFSPLSASLLSKAITDLSQLPAHGIFHVGGALRVSKYDFALSFFEFFGLDKALLSPALVKDAHLTAPRPIDMSMSVERVQEVLGYKMPSLSQSFESIRDDYKD